MAYPSVVDVAQYILRKHGPMTTWKLQKLVYYCQAWSLVWDDDQLFPEEIRAWANGPVVRELYDKHRGLFSADASRFSDREPYRFSDEQRETINIVLNGYGDKSPQWLSDLTHMEDPWRNARKGMSDRQRGNTVIPKQDLAEYYGSILPG